MIKQANKLIFKRLSAINREKENVIDVNFSDKQNDDTIATSTGVIKKKKESKTTMHGITSSLETTFLFR